MESCEAAWIASRLASESASSSKVCACALSEFVKTFVARTAFSRAACKFAGFGALNNMTGWSPRRSSGRAKLKSPVSNKVSK